MSSILHDLLNLGWPLQLGAVALLLFAALCVFALVTAAGTADTFITTILKPGTSGTKKLIVLVHGWTLDSKSMEPVEEAALSGRPGADVLLVGYAAPIFSNASPYGIAAQLDEKIEQLQSEKQYADIALCGFSTGALLVRKAYVYGCGSIADTPAADPKKDTSGIRKAWVDQVDRIVLLAGMNRGASVDEKAKNATYWRYHVNRLALLVARVTSTGHLERECIRGAPFIANLRLQWLRTLRAAEMNDLKRPTVIQLLGTKDDLVSHEDSRDVTVAKGFIWVPVNNTGHFNIITLDQSPSGQERRNKIALAFGDENAVANLKRQSPATTIDEDLDVETVVFVLHGIRDMGEWTSQFTRPLQEAHARQQPGSATKLVVYPASYGYFGMGPFLLGTDRQKNVRWFMDRVTELTAKYPNMKQLHFIGHSNGTYVLGSALERYVTLRVNRVVLAGSVLRRDYPWSDFTGRVGAVRNYVGSDDIIVGMCPKVFEMPGFNLLNRDIGGAGYDGFLAPSVSAIEERFVRGGHSAALDNRNVQSIADFIAEEKVTRTDALYEQAHPPRWNIYTNLCWAAWIVAVIILVGAFVALPPVLAWLLGFISPAWSEQVTAMKSYVRFGYVAILWLILRTI